MNFKYYWIAISFVLLGGETNADEWSYLFCRANEGASQFRYVINETKNEADIFGSSDYRGKPIQRNRNGLVIEWLENQDATALAYTKQDNIADSYLQRHTINLMTMSLEVIFRRYIGLPNPSPTSHTVAETERVKGSCWRSR